MAMHSPATTAPAQTRSAPPSGAVAIVASAGGIPALIELLAELPRGFALPVFVTLHLARGPSLVPDILAWHSALAVDWAIEGEQPRCGHVYLAPPGTSLTIGANGLALAALPPISASWLGTCDRLIDSVAAVYGPHSVAIVLSGMMPAGIQGLRAIRACGGITMAQNDASSAYFDMPCAAIDFGKADIVLPPSRLASALQVIAEQWAISAHASQANTSACD
jgi:two-component system, chemotaxis family, protein-glutamate methylesterase/glutaminase